MKICIFFDGQNFYRSLLRYDESLRVDYDRLALWITQKVGGDGAVFGGAYYYVGVSSGAPQQVEAFLRAWSCGPATSSSAIRACDGRADARTAAASTSTRRRSAATPRSW